MLKPHQESLSDQIRRHIMSIVDGTHLGIGAIYRTKLNKAFNVYSRSTDVSKEINNQELKSMPIVTLKQLHDLLSQHPEYTELPEVQLPTKARKSKSETMNTDFISGQNHKCLFCGRYFFGGDIRAHEITIEHLVPKSVWMKEMIEAQKIMLRLSKAGRIKEFEEPSAFIASVIKSNVINSVDNWAFSCDACNLIKGVTPMDVFIDFASRFASLDHKSIVAQNNERYREAMNFGEPIVNVSGVRFTKRRSTLVLADALIKLLNDHIDDSMTAYIRRKKKTSNDFQLLTYLFELAESLGINTQEVINIKNLNDRLLNPGPQAFVNIKGLVASKKDNLCALCGEPQSSSSPLGGSYLVATDLFLNIEEHNFQLVHSECSRLMAGMAMPYFERHMKMIDNYTPQREIVLKNMDTNILSIYHDFQRALDELRQFSLPEFNLQEQQNF